MGICGDTVIQNEKRKSGLVSRWWQEKLADLFLVFPARLKTSPKVFHLYFFIKHSRNEAFRNF